ncbi:chemotaxis protein CheW [Methanomicrobium antiquum]|uniref:Chemotaxis protein CheW n=1 Tax=Methanomicrobium antiquum TaxID=487686 RepID=A0AAF0FRH5_9EURY|nr:chemotaxis protein CheW [Methanomicrobium antiquum]MDD3976729.1 chemotaxis protein CheW [Methanomicrobium sp.]WFN36516.1 chemotaxis protein CheW [Methanomicrobium antiquum]
MSLIDVVEFEICNEHYALDISLTREIVEMVPITPVPRAPPHIAGIINLRGEITNIINLNQILNLKENAERETQKIIVLVPDAAEGSNTGIIVDDVHAVLQISEDEIEPMKGSLSSEAYVKGIIKIKEMADGEEKKKLILWLDVGKVLTDMLAAAKA